MPTADQPLKGQNKKQKFKGQSLMIRKKASSLFHDQVVVIQRSDTKYRMI